jgi:site-specific DNA-methyltransferase (adenine-specific)
LILASSNEGDLVVDPFAGSGSTAISAIQLNRNFITIDSDEIYYNEVLNRVERTKNPLGIVI